MAARAMWKGVIGLGEGVPVKLYSAVEDRDVHFRLLHESDRVPVRQQLVNPETDEAVPFEDTRRGLVTDDGELVVFEQDELDALEPEASRDIEVLAFLPHEEIDHRWYLRPYYLGPDGKEERYFALIEALERSQREGLVRWTMRNKEYRGALVLHSGYPLLISLRSAEQVIPASALQAPSGKDLDEKELAMAVQLMGMLEGPFEPEGYRDEYRGRVEELIAAKAKGEPVKQKRRRRTEEYDELSEALRASLQKGGMRA